jgi:hypothetical protein
MHNGYFRYYLPAQTPDRRSLIHIPYWRFKGMWYTFQLSQTAHRFIDTSQQAIALRGIPATLGLRPQAMKMRFVLPGTPGRFIKPQLPKTEALRLAEKRMLNTSKSPSLHQAFIGETISIIYAPFYGENKLFDGILEQPLKDSPDPETFPPAESGSSFAKQFHFIPTLCPACGWDMEGQKDALVLHCRNCTTAWMASREGFQQIPFACWQAAQKPAAAFYLPFWRIKADIRGMQLDSYADLVRSANLPKAVQEKWRKRTFYFWVPAFKIKPQLFLRLSTQLTLSQPQWKPIEGKPASPANSVTLPLKEAIECVTLTLGEIVKPRKSIATNIQQLQIKPASAGLVYLPFQESHHEYICPELQIAINKKVLAHAGNL